MSKYNLQLLKDAKNRGIITQWVNGRVGDYQVEALLDKVCGKTEEKNETVEENQADEVAEELNEAIKGNKPQIVAFAEKYDVDISECSNNEERIKAIQDWFKNK